MRSVVRTFGTRCSSSHNLNTSYRSTSLLTHQCRRLSRYDNSQRNEGLKDELMTQIKCEPEFLRDLIRKVRHKGKNDPRVVEATDILTDYILKADINGDGVITREEMSIWLRRNSDKHDKLKHNNVFYVPAEEQSGSGESKEATNTQIRQHMIKTAIPFVGFGFLDNVIMIISGNEIESYFGVSLGISAMAAAGLGNTLSDIVGIQAGGMIEAMSEKLGIHDPDLTKEQLKSRLFRILTVLASMIGITIGCLLGMFPLMFIDEDRDGDKCIRVIFDSVDTDNSGELDLKELDKLFDLLCEGKFIDDPQQARNFMRSCGFDEQDTLNFDEFRTLFNVFVQKSVVEKYASKKRTDRAIAPAGQL